MFQMRNKDKTPEKELSEVDIGNLPENEFKVVTRKMIKELGRMDAQNEKLEAFNKELENLKNSQTDMKNTITNKKYTRRTNNRLNDTEE